MANDTHKAGMLRTVACCGMLLGGYPAGGQPMPRGEIVRTEPVAGAGFHWAYFSYLPHSAGLVTDTLHVYVAPNVSPGGNDTLEFHDRHARRMIDEMIERAETLGLPALVPAFPRSHTQWWLYTHALNRAIMTLPDGPMARPDSQLIAMVDHLRKRLAEDGLRVSPKVILEGFSAGGMFVNRFCLLHPDRVLAATVGAPGGFPMLPIKAYKGESLRYPVGLADLDSLLGATFDLTAFRNVRLRFYMGRMDKNDSVPNADSFEPEDGEQIRRLFGENILDRFRRCEAIYAGQKLTRCTFTLYPETGHTITAAMIRDNMAFYRKALEHP